MPNGSVMPSDDEVYETSNVGNEEDYVLKTKKHSGIRVTIAELFKIIFDELLGSLSKKSLPTKWSWSLNQFSGPKRPNRPIIARVLLEHFYELMVQLEQPFSNRLDPTHANRLLEGDQQQDGRRADDPPAARGPRRWS